MTDFESQIVQFYAERFPSQTPVKLLDYARMVHGLASDVYSVTLDAAGREVALVVKSYTGEDEGAAMQSAYNEFFTLRYLGVTGFPVPESILLEMQPDLIGKPFIVMQRIEGQVLWDVIQTQPERRADLINLCCRLLVDLHTLDAYPFEPVFGTRNLNDPCAPVQDEIRTLRATIRRGGRSEFEPVVAWLDAHHSSAPTTRLSLLHRDYHPWNVILTPDGHPYVIDWNSDISDYRFDVAWTVQLMARAGHDDFARQMRTVYEELSGAPLEAFDFFEVAATVRWMLNVLHSLDTGAALRADARAEFRKFLAPMLAKGRELLCERTGINIPIAV